MEAICDRATSIAAALSGSMALDGRTCGVGRVPADVRMVRNADGWLYRSLSMSRRWRAVVAALAAVGAAGCTGSGHHSSPISNRTAEFYVGRIESCHAGHALRPGLDNVMVPPGAIALTVCSEQPQFAGNPSQTRNTVRGNFAQLVAVLNAGTSQPAKFACNAGGLARHYILVFRYSDGPEVAVAVGPDCQPSITNGRRLANNTHDVVVAINRLIKSR